LTANVPAAISSVAVAGAPLLGPLMMRPPTVLLTLLVTV